MLMSKMIKFTGFLFSLYFVVLFAQINNNFRCDYEFSEKAKYYFKYHEIPANWYEARLRCDLEGATLASPLNLDIINELLSILDVDELKMAPAIFTGVHAIFSRGDFHSVEGNSLWKIPHRWANEEPDNKNDDESCLVFMSDATMADKNCREIFPYVCYKKFNPIARPNECGTTDDKYTLKKESGSCYKFHKIPRTYSRAFLTCSAEGGYLAIIDDKTEAKIIKNLYAKYPSTSIRGNFWKETAFVGYHDFFEPLDFYTIHGIPIRDASYDQFSEYEPENGTSMGRATGGESCISVNRSAELLDVRCPKNSMFICEKDPLSLTCNYTRKSF